MGAGRHSPLRMARVAARAHVVAQMRLLRSSGLRTALKEGPHAALELLEVEWLRKVVVRADSHSLLFGIGGAECSDQNHIDVVVVAPDRANKIHSIHAWHIHIGDHKIALMERKLFKRCNAILGL